MRNGIPVAQYSYCLPNQVIGYFTKGFSMRVRVDPETCIGCELCPSICPDLFQMGDDGIARTIIEHVPEEMQDCANEAAQSCPVEAIKVF
jgi:ferredoxin